MRPLAESTRAVLAGAICLAIVGGMLVGHAWPLWTGQDVLMAATVTGAPRWTSGEYVSLSTASDSLIVGTVEATTQSQVTIVRPIEPWLKLDVPGVALHARGTAVYVQLEPGTGGGVTPVSVSLRPVAGAVNLRGIVSSVYSGVLQVQYGIDAFYMQEGHAKAVERAVREKRNVQIQVAIAKSGRARIRNLLVDGVPVQ